MKTNIILTSVIAGSIAATAVVFSRVGASVSFESVIGYLTVATVIAIAALEYGLSRKRVLATVRK